MASATEDSDQGKTRDLSGRNTCTLGSGRFRCPEALFEHISTEDYVARITEGRNDLCCTTGACITAITAVSSSPGLSDPGKGLEVLCVVDPADEYAILQLMHCGGKPLESTAKEDLDIESKDGMKMLEVGKAAFEPPDKLVVDALGDKTEKGQNNIFYITGECVTAIHSRPFLENVRNKGLGVQFTVDPGNEYDARLLKDSGGDNLKSLAVEGLDSEGESRRKKLEELEAEFKLLNKLMKEVHGDRTEGVAVSGRTADSPLRTDNLRDSGNRGTTPQPRRLHAEEMCSQRAATTASAM